MANATKKWKFGIRIFLRTFPSRQRDITKLHFV